MKYYLRWKTFAILFFAAIIAAGIFGFAHSQQASALDNGLAETPPMGWNDWNAFGCDVDADLIKETADKMVQSGMKEAGYKYVNIDDCWMTHQRDEDGNLVVDPDKFPDGMKAVADYVHSLGLKIGIYESAGTETCAGYPGSIGHEEQDAEAFASWGIDYLKYDNCGDHLGQSPQDRYTKMRDALAATDRDIVYSLCEWGSNAPWEWAESVGNLWRTTGDISDNWSSMVSILDQQEGLYKYAGPGHWNDPDMLEVGNGGMTSTEYRAHFSLWSILAAPLLAGNDIRDMSETTKDILTNEEVIAVDQDSAGIQGHKIKDDGDHEVWMKPLKNGDRAVVLFNRGESNATMSIEAEELDLKKAPAYIVRDLWAHKETATANKISASVPSHGVAMFRVSRGTPDQAPPSATISTDFPGLVTPGETKEMTITLTNNGKIAMRDVEFSLDTPDGWNITPSSKTTFDEVSPEGVGRSVQTTWDITAPENVEPGTVNLMADITHKYKGKTIHLQTPLSVQVPPAAPTQDAYLSDLPYFGDPTNGWGPVEQDTSNGGSASGDGNPITLNGTTYSKGLGVHAYSEVSYYLNGNFSSFESDIGLDDEKNDSPGSVIFQVWGDGLKLYDSDVMTDQSETQHLNIDISDVEVLKLVVTDAEDGNDSDHADWADAKIKVDTDQTPTEFNPKMNEEDLQSKVTIPNTEIAEFTWDAENAENELEDVYATFDGESYKEGTTIELAGKPGKHQLVLTAIDEEENVTVKSYEINVTTSAADMKTLVERFEDQGDFKNEQAAHALKLHLIAVSHYEGKDSAEKVVKHMKGFKVLLDHQKENDLISGEVYKTLNADTDYMLRN